MMVFDRSRGGVPRATPHLLADYIELEALFGEISEISRAEIASLLNEGKELGDEDLPGADASLSTAELNDFTLRYAEEAIRHIGYRAQAFGTYYPFSMSGELFRKSARLTQRQQFYIFLLICSRLGVFTANSGLRQRFAGLFEAVSADVLRSLFPAMTVRQFGPGSVDRQQYFGNGLREAFVRLGEDLKTEAMVEPIARTNLGDRGIDVVGYHEWDDSANGLFAVFAQCAARNIEWPKKALEAVPSIHRGVLNLRHDPYNVLFVPLCCREPSGDWADPGYPWSVVLVDRLRIVRAISNNHRAVARLVRTPIVTRVLGERFVA